MGFLAGKKALITGVASKRSIAWGIAQAIHREGAELAFTYQGEKLQGRVETFAQELGSDIALPLDVANDEDIDALYEQLGKHWDNFDILVHSIAYAPRDQLEGRYIDVMTRDGFHVAHDISSYSFGALAKGARPFMAGRNGSMITMTYLGAVRALPNYNVMGLAKASLEANVRFLAQDLGREGIRVNGISAGPIKTLAAAGISGFRKMLDHVANISPLKRNVSINDVGNAAAFLASDLSAGITGEILYVDAGYSQIGMSLD